MKRHFRTFVFILAVFPLLYIVSLGAISETNSVPDHGFNGIWTVRADGGIELFMRDGSHIILGPRGGVDPRRIGKTDQPILRRDARGRINFAADHQGTLIYIFQYSRDDTWVVMTDPEAMVSVFGFDKATGRVVEALLPSGERIRFP